MTHQCDHNGGFGRSALGVPAVKHLIFVSRVRMWDTLIDRFCVAIDNALDSQQPERRQR